jgi:hypothetical protein
MNSSQMPFVRSELGSNQASRKMLITVDRQILRIGPSEEAHAVSGDHQILESGPEAGQQAGEIVCRERLGGLLKYYHRQAA